MGTSTTRRHASTSARSWYDSPWRIAAHAVATAGTVAVVALVIAIAGVPRLTGGASLTVLTGSMEPTLSPGDVIVVRGIDADEVCATVTIGTIVTFLPEPRDPTLISHRVIGKTIGDFDDGTTCRLITHGDANSAADNPVSPEQVRGVFLYGIPKLGWVRQWVGNNVPLVLTIAATALIAWGVWSGFRRPRTRVYTLPATAGSLDAAGSSAASDPPAASGPLAASAPPDVSGFPVTGVNADAPARHGTAPAPAPAPAPETADLRERELTLRERELQLRERELDFALRQAALTNPAHQIGPDQSLAQSPPPLPPLPPVTNHRPETPPNPERSEI